MATPADIVRIALSQNGYHDGQGYDEPSLYAQAFGINSGIAYCDIFVAWVYERAGVPLPKMGSWIRTGSQYCPDSWNYAVRYGATRNSWEAQPGWQVIFDWTGTGNLGPESHTEIVEKWENGVLYTVGGNSGPSNLDGFKGTGGVHRHAWSAPAGVGNNLIMGVIDTSKLVKFGGAQPNKPPVNPPSAGTEIAANLAFMPIIDPGLPTPYAHTLILVETLLRTANPGVDLSTPAARTQAVKEWQAILYNEWRLTGGKHPERVTGKADWVTMTRIMTAIALQDKVTK